jgi:hypothetical protein
MAFELGELRRGLGGSIRLSIGDGGDDLEECRKVNPSAPFIGRPVATTLLTIGKPRVAGALLILRDKAIKPLLAAAQPLRPKRGAHNPKPIDLHYDAIQAAMKGVFHELGLAA